MTGEATSETLKYPSAIPHCELVSVKQPRSRQMDLELRVRQFDEHPELRFTKVKFRSKRPLEKDWVNKPYTYEEILPHIHLHTNYGVLCGYGGLAVPDADSPELEEVIEKNLPETFTVKTGGGGKHYYYLCPEVHKRILLEREGSHYGEVQSFGQQVIGPGSVHPGGKRYAIARDLPIVEIAFAELEAALKPFMKVHKEPESPALAPRPDRVFDINAIPIRDIIDISEYKRAANGELHGPNPWHGSATGMNTWVNEEKNVAYCFRHNAGITVAKAIALNEGILRNCDDELSRAGFIQVLKIANRKYGLRRE